MTEGSLNQDWIFVDTQCL